MIKALQDANMASFRQLVSDRIELLIDHWGIGGAFMVHCTKCGQFIYGQERGRQPKGPSIFCGCFRKDLHALQHSASVFMKVAV